MTLALADRVQDSTTTTGTGTITLSGSPPAGFQSFATIGNGNTTYYTITSGSAWEVGIGTYSSTGPTLTRTTILSSSNAGAAISLTGTSTVFVSYPAEYAVQSQSPTITTPTFASGGFTTTPQSSPPSASTGVTWYDSSKDSLSYYNSTNYEVNTGQEVNQLCYNNTGTSIPSGTAVYLSGGSSGNYPYITPAIATSQSTANMVGITGQAIANGVIGVVVILGEIYSYNTIGMTTGQTLYLSAATAGALTTTQPSSPFYAVRAGFVIVGGSTTGSVFVSVRNVYTLGSNIISPVTFTAFSTSSVPLKVYGLSGQFTEYLDVYSYNGGNLLLQVPSSGGITIGAMATSYTNTFKVSATASASVTYTLPVNAGTSGYVLSTDGTGITSWVANSSSGTVTSVNASGGTTGLSFSGGPVTTSGTLTLGGTLAVANGGTGVTTSTGTGSVVLSTSPTLVTPALGTPSSGTVTNLTGTASININGTVGATTPTTGAFTTATASTSVTSPFHIANGTITSALTAGAYSYGTLGYSDTGIFSSFTLSQNSYNQMILQNSNAGAAASADFIVSNNNGTASTYYGDFGINSSGFTGSGSLNLANAVYVYSNSSDLVLGTVTSNAIHFVVNSGTTDAVSIATTGKTTFQASSTTAASINLTPGAAPTVPVNGDMWSTTAGVYAQVNGSTVGPFGTGGGGGTLTVGSTATSGGAAGQIMFDTGSVLSESSSLTFASATRKLTVGGPTTFSAGTSNSVAAWSMSGVNFVQSAATFTDNTTGTSGTVTTAYMNLFGAQTYASVSTGVQVGILYGTYFVAPLTGTNVIAGTKWAVGADSLYVSGAFTQNSGAVNITATGNIGITTNTGSISLGSTQGSGTITVGSTTGSGSISLGLSTSNQTVNVASGAVASAFTKTVNIGTSGVAGSTTVINIGATAGTSTTTLNGSTIATGTIQTQGYTVATLPAAGTVGRRAHVTDATLPTFLGTLTGGGTVKCPVFDNGTAWVAG